MENETATPLKVALTGGLERLCLEVQKEMGCCGLEADTMYGQFAMEVARRAVAAEREACASICEEMHEQGDVRRPISRDAFWCAINIRKRSNAELSAQPKAVRSDASLGDA